MERINKELAMIWNWSNCRAWKGQDRHVPKSFWREGFERLAKIRRCCNLHGYNKFIGRAIGKTFHQPWYKGKFGLILKLLLIELIFWMKAGLKFWILGVFHYSLLTLKLCLLAFARTPDSQVAPDCRIIFLLWTLDLFHFYALSIYIFLLYICMFFR